jgi:hypothetical protein
MQRYKPCNRRPAGTENLLPFAIEAARQRATIGEMSDAMAREFGRHRATIQGVRGVWKQHMQASADIGFAEKTVSMNLARRLAVRRVFLLPSLARMDMTVGKKSLPRHLPIWDLML